MLVRCDTRKHRNYAILTDIFFARQDAKKGTALHDGVGSLMFFFFSSDSRGSQDTKWTIQPAVEHADGAFLFIQHCCLFELFFLHIGRKFLSSVCEICGRVGQLGTRNIFGHEKVRSIGQKRWRRISLPEVRHRRVARKIEFGS